MQIVDITEKELVDENGVVVGKEGALNSCLDCLSGESQYKVVDVDEKGVEVSFYLCAEHLAARGLTVTE